MCIWPLESLLSCNTSSVTFPATRLNFFLCLCSLFFSQCEVSVFSKFSLFSLVLFSRLHYRSLYLLLFSSHNFSLDAFCYFLSVSFSHLSCCFIFFLSLVSVLSQSHRLPLCLPSLILYHTDTFRLQNLCVAPLCSSSSYLIFHDTLHASEQKICMFLNNFTLGSTQSISGFFPRSINLTATI